MSRSGDACPPNCTHLIGVPSGSPGPCVQRLIHRAWQCGEDPETAVRMAQMAMDRRQDWRTRRDLRDRRPGGRDHEPPPARGGPDHPASRRVLVATGGGTTVDRRDSPLPTGSSEGAIPSSATPDATLSMTAPNSPSRQRTVLGNYDEHPWARIRTHAPMARRSVPALVGSRHRIARRRRLAPSR